MNKKFFRLAGWGTLVSAVLILAAFISFPLGAGMFGGVLEILGVLLLIFVFYALYVAHRSESKGLSLAAFIISIVAIVVDITSMINNGPTYLYNLWYTLLSLPFLIFGYLAWRDTRMPRGLAVLALLAGIFFLISGISGFLVSTELADNISLIAILAMFVWLFWLWRVFWSKKFSTDIPEPPAA